MKLKKKMAGKDVAFNICNYGVFALLTLICAYPFYYLIINTISSNTLSANGNINFLPREIHFENYKQVFALSGLGTAALVSLGKTVIGTACTVLAAAFLGFMFTQEKMWGRKFWYRFIVVTMYFNAGVIPMFITMKNLHLTNTFWVYIIPAIVQPFNIILVKTYVESLPKALQELTGVRRDDRIFAWRLWKQQNRDNCGNQSRNITEHGRRHRLGSIRRKYRRKQIQGFYHGGCL